MSMKTMLTPLLCVAVAAGAQVSSPRPASTQAPVVAQPAPIVSLLPSLQQTTASINSDVARLRIEKWKAESSVRQQSQQNADSISRNITAALPGMMDQVRANPQSLAAAVKLYRNVNALYDVFSGLADSAGAFGSRQEYDALASDANKLDNVRRTLGERLENMAAANDAEIVRLRTQATRPAAPPPPPKKIIVDEERPTKPSPKKKAAAKPAPQAAPQPQ